MTEDMYMCSEWSTINEQFKPTKNNPAYKIAKHNPIPWYTYRKTDKEDRDLLNDQTFLFLSCLLNIKYFGILGEALDPAYPPYSGSPLPSLLFNLLYT